MALKKIAVVLLVVVNIGIAFLGFVLVAAGAVILVADQVAGDEMGKLVEQVGDIGESIGLADVQDTTTDTDELVKDIMEFAQDAAIAFILCGAVIFFLGLFGCMGACCEWNAALVIYAIVALAVSLIMAIVVGLFFDGQFNDEIRDTVQTMIDDKFVAIDSYAPESMLINFIQLKFECCGLDNYLDYRKATSWDRIRAYEVTDGITVDRLLVTPISCCLTDGDFPDVTPVDDECATAPRNDTSNWYRSCWNEVTDELEQYRAPLMAVTILLVIFIFFLSLAAFYVFFVTMCTNQKVEPE